MEPRTLARRGLGLIVLALLWLYFGPFGWILVGSICLLAAGGIRFAGLLEGKPHDTSSDLVRCPSCQALEAPGRDACRACGESL